MFTVSSPFREDPFFSSTIKTLQEHSDGFFGKEFNVTTPTVFTTTQKSSQTKQEHSSSQNAPTFTTTTPTTSGASTADGSVSSDEDSKMFTVKVDVQQYNPEELEVKTVDNYIVITGKHEEKREDGTTHISRQFSRRYGIPKGVKSENIKCSLTSEGKLVLSARMLENKPTGKGVNISISSISSCKSSNNNNTESEEARKQ